jgi:hypothetical protein
VAELVEEVAGMARRHGSINVGDAEQEEIRRRFAAGEPLRAWRWRSAVP